ncbi:MAG: hypothetical protein NTV58_00325 [Deltaproteobacteria bacterium]|nr:hypothetical protein [Deltaproteobacteria bacterium]
MRFERNIHYLFFIFVIMILNSCGPAQQFTMWEDQQQSAPQSSPGLPGNLHVSDEFIDITFTVISEQEINFRLQNKTSGRITIHWDEVLCKFPTGAVMQLINSGNGTDTDVQPMSVLTDSLSPLGPIPYLADEDDWRDADDSIDFEQEFSIEMPLYIDASGGKKDYTFTFVLS